MPSSEILCIGDLHLGCYKNIFSGVSHPKIFTLHSDDVIYDCIRQAHEYAVDQGIRHIVFLGDIFDTPFPDQYEQMYCINMLISLKPINVHIILGNHDYSSKLANSLILSKFAAHIASLDHVRIYHTPESGNIDGVPVNFLPWPHNKKPSSQTKNSVNFAHIEIPGSVSDSGKVFTEGYKIKRNNDFWIIGHLHTYQKYKNVIYPGNLLQKNFGESLPKGFLHAKISSRNDLITVKSRLVPTSPYIELVNAHIKTPADLTKVKENTEISGVIRLYKLFLYDFEIPKDIIAQHTNIIYHEKIRGKSTSKEQEAAEKHSITNAHSNVMQDMTDFLKQRGLSKKQVIFAKTELQKLLSERQSR